MNKYYSDVFKGAIYIDVQMSLSEYSFPQSTSLCIPTMTFFIDK
jgi:hypothetical protein